MEFDPVACCYLTDLDSESTVDHQRVDGTSYPKLGGLDGPHLSKTSCHRTSETHNI